MFLSKKWIFILIALTGIAFMILLVIQFGWVSKSIEMDRQQVDKRMRKISNKIRQSFLNDRDFQETYLSGSDEIKDLSIDGHPAEGFETAIKQKVDSMLEEEHAPLSSAINGRTGKPCYLMSYIPPEQHNSSIDQSQYKMCLCNNHYPVSFDIGINLLSPGKLTGGNSSKLILPSVILILLLIALFAYAIYIINRQKKLAELKNDFINNLTHEFNTPLFSMGITSNLLLRSEAVQQSDKLKSYVELITREKLRIQSQVDKILQLTAIESGSVIMEKNKIDLHELIEETIKGFEMIVTEKNGKFIFNSNANNYFINGDRLHLLNALNNLLDNACKYSDRNPLINITTININGELVINISDNGIGMSKAETNMIFNKFYRVKNGDRHDVKGFGLGLSYVKKIVELHKGSVEVKSKPGEGSVFIIHLPYPSNS